MFTSITWKYGLIGFAARLLRWVVANRNSHSSRFVSIAYRSPQSGRRQLPLDTAPASTEDDQGIQVVYLPTNSPGMRDRSSDGRQSPLVGGRSGKAFCAEGHRQILRHLPQRETENGRAAA